MSIDNMYIVIILKYKSIASSVNIVWMVINVVL